MLTLASFIVSTLACRFRKQADLELEGVAVRHELTVLRLQSARRRRLSSIGGSLRVWLYRLWLPPIENSVPWWWSPPRTGSAMMLRNA